MCFLGRSVWLVLVFIVLLSCVKNGMGIKRVIWVGNTLIPEEDVALSCTIGEYRLYIIPPGDHLQWDDFDDLDDLECIFQWNSQTRHFRMYDDYRDGDCNPCKWIIKEGGPCRYNGTFSCYRWPS